MERIIAETHCVYKSAEGETKPIRIYVREPYDLNEGGTWCCYCHIEGIQEKEQRAFGEGSMQALCLALAMLKIDLRFHEACGGTYYHPGDLTTPVKAEDLLGDNVAMPEFRK